MALADRDYTQRNPAPNPAGGTGGGRGRGKPLLIVVLLAVISGGVYLYKHFVSDRAQACALLVNINTAKQAELETLHGIGPTLAKKIVADRPFATVNDLARVSGISEREVQKLLPWLTVNEATHCKDGN